MFGKNKRKTDSRVRFQNPRFRQQLQKARQYTRTTRTLPDSSFEIYLSKIGLGSWLRRSLCLLVLLLLVYIVYIPNVFFIKYTVINGATNEAETSIQKSVNFFLEKKAPWPQKNLMLLSKPKLNAFLLENNQTVFKINKISKKFPSTLILDVTPRTNVFAVQTLNGAYLISNDGLVNQDIPTDASGTLPNLPILIKIDSTESLIVGHQAFNQNTVDFISQLIQNLSNIVKSPPSSYEMADLNSSDLTINFDSGFKILFDTSLDINQTLSRLSLLFSQFSDSYIKKLYYVDMRFEGRGYVCEKQLPCVTKTVLPSDNATTTEPAITN